MKTITLDDVQLRNLLEFLNRTSLRGSEAAAFINLINVFLMPTQERGKEEGEECPNTPK